MIDEATLEGESTTGSLASGSGAGPALVPALALLHADEGRRPVELLRLQGEGHVIGRGSDEFSGAPLHDGRMSREHLRIYAHRGRFCVADAGSRNGTRLNGQPLEAPKALSIGDVVRAGDSLFAFTLDCDLPPLPDGASMVGVSAAMRGVWDEVGRLAQAPATVLVTGETGTGKELICQALHQRSDRDGPFRAVNCAALPESLLESELFGHAPGAFTGATQAAAGLFQSARDGSLLLDEVGELPLPAQAKLLRVLETGKVRPVGGKDDIDARVRVLAATNRDLRVEVREGRFRMDLYARLSQRSLSVAPLRDRREDIPALLRHVLAQREAADRALRPSLVEALLLHPWPLNVRGLAHLVDAALHEARPGDALTLTPRIREALADETALLQAPAPAQSSPNRRRRAPPADTLEALLRKHHGAVAEVARSLSATRQQVYRWLGIHDLNPNDYR